MLFPFKIPKWIFFALGGLVLVMTPLAVSLPIYTTSNPTYCLSCHGTGETPDRGIPSNVHPSFAEVTCTDCHAKSGQFVYEGYVKGFMSEPERVSPNCVSCHEDIPTRNSQDGFEFNVMDIKIPHKLHFDRGAKCTDCHANIAHDLTEAQTNRPRMEYCSQCHATTQEACGKCHGQGVPPGPIPPMIPAGVVADAKSLYGRYCTECHGLRGDHIPEADLSSTEFLVDQGFSALEKIAGEGHGGMPAFGSQAGGPLTHDEIRAIIAHLKLAAEGPGYVDGQALYDTNCAVCHGVEGDKMPTVDLSSPEYLQGLSDDIIVKAISAGKAGMPAWGKPNGGDLSYDEIVAIERYVTSLAGVRFGEDSIRGIYVEYCVTCHGEVGALIVEANIGSRDFLSSQGDEVMIDAIADGKGSMPAFSKAKGGELSDDHIASLLQYLNVRAGLSYYAVARIIPHDLAGRDNCMACHGPENFKPVPPSHEGRVVDTCLNCHQPAIVHPSAETTPFGIDPLAVPHAIGGRAEQCLACHEMGIGNAPKFPDNHIGRTDTMCLECHYETSPDGTPEIASGGEITGPIAFAKDIPHLIEGYDQCLECHSQDATKPYPEDHAGRSVDICLLCHTTTAQAASAVAPSDVTPPKIRHDLAGRDDCLVCHPPANQWHERRIPVMCSMCHQPADAPESASQPPVISHGVENIDDCLICHAIDSYIPFPTTHQDQEFTSDTCRLCHQPGEE